MRPWHQATHTARGRAPEGALKRCRPFPTCRATGRDLPPCRTLPRSANPQGCGPGCPRDCWRASSAARKSALPFGSPGCHSRCGGAPLTKPGRGPASRPRGGGAAGADAAAGAGTGAGAEAAAGGGGNGAGAASARGCAITRTGSCFASPQAAKAIDATAHAARPRALATALRALRAVTPTVMPTVMFAPAGGRAAFTAAGSRRTRATPNPRRTPCSCPHSWRCAGRTPCSPPPSW